MPVKLGIGAPLGKTPPAFKPPAPKPVGLTPQKRLEKSQGIGSVDAFDQKTQGIKLQKYEPMSMLGTKLGFQTSQYSGPLSMGGFMARHPLGMAAYSTLARPQSLTQSVKSAGPPSEYGPNPGEEGRAQILEKKAGVAWAARNALEAVGEWQEKQAGAPLTPAGRLAHAQQKGQPKLTAPPGPSIAQIAKPKGFGKPLAGATKSAGLVKAALLAELVRVGLKDVRGTPRLLMKARSPREREVIGRLVRKKYNRAVTQPLMGVAEKGISKLPGERPKKVLRTGAKMVARDPLGQLAANLVPIPGASAGYEGLKAGLSKAINVMDPVSSRASRLTRAVA